MKNINKKLAAGIFLIVLAVTSLVVWETVGREKLLYREVLTAKEPIAAGTEINRNLFEETEFLATTVLDGAITDKTFDKIEGSLAKQYIPKGGQMVEEYIYKDDFYISEGESIYSIPAEWLSSFSSSIRRGDYIDMYTSDGREKIGSYRVAFVKSQSVEEVTNITTQEMDEPLDRTDATAPVSFVEIITTLPEYEKIYALATGSAHFALGGSETESFGGVPMKFLLIQTNTKGK